MPNGVNTGYTYDGLGRLTHLLEAKSSTTILDNQLSYNTAHQITQIGDAGGTHEYGYDDVDRLLSAAYPGADDESYEYDAVGNRTSSAVYGEHTYEPFNRLASAGRASFSYDNNGNQVVGPYPFGEANYIYDFENRLTEATDSWRGPLNHWYSNTVDYAYDALGRRIWRSNSNGATQRFVYDGNDVIQDLDGDGQVVTSYLNGPGIDNKIRQTDSVNGNLYYTTDHLGSTRALTDGSGNVAEQIDYDSFGNSTGSALTRYTYTGREFDSDTRLYYYRARFYDPHIGRFISEDPVGFEGGLNWFSYVDNNPLQYVDPNGLTKGDRWYGYRNRDFQRWFHRCWKRPGDPDADKDEIESAYAEWIYRGSPKCGNCWGGRTPSPSECREPVPARKRIPGPSLEEFRLQEEAARQMEIFWTKVLIGDAVGGAVLLAPEGTAAALVRWIIKSGRRVPVPVPVH